MANREVGSLSSSLAHSFVRSSFLSVDMFACSSFFNASSRHRTHVTFIAKKHGKNASIVKGRARCKFVYVYIKMMMRVVGQLSYAIIILDCT